MAPHCEQYRQLVKVYGVEYLADKSPLEQRQIYLVDLNDTGFSWTTKNAEGVEVTKTDYPYLRK